ncbi:hypothetical protein OXX80_003388 [Metschnikowia pulcherrima]
MLFPTSSLLFFTLAAATLSKGYVNYTVSTITTRILATKTYLVPVWVDDDDDDDEASTSGHMGKTSSALVTNPSFLEISNTDAVSTKFPEFTDTFSKSIHNPDPTEVKIDATSPVTNAFSTTPISTVFNTVPSENSYEGDCTWFHPSRGACGVMNTDSDHVVALAHGFFDRFTPGRNPNKNTCCGKKIRVHHGGRSVEAIIGDRFGGGKPHSLGLSPSAFKKLANPWVGHIKVRWEWM